MDVDTNSTRPLSRSKPTLLSLPQGLQNMIFDYAYPMVPNVSYLNRRAWEEKDQSCPTNLFPEPKVNDFLVSKQFFQNAAKAYMSNQVVNVSTNNSMSSTFSTMVDGGISRAFETDDRFFM